MKKMITSLVTVCLILSLAPLQQVFAKSDKEIVDINSLSIEVKDVKFESNKDLTNQEVEERLNEILKKYDVNEPFSDEDEEFIKAYTSPTKPGMDEKLIGTFGFTDFNDTRTESGITANFGGTLYDFDGDGLNRSFRAIARLRVTDGFSKVDKLSMEIKMQAIGPVGFDGNTPKLGLVFNRTETPSTTTSSQLLYDRTFTYYGLIWSTYISATGIVTYSGGSQFDLK